jgi:hypothetical protein
VDAGLIAQVGVTGTGHAPEPPPAEPATEPQGEDEALLQRVRTEQALLLEQEALEERRTLLDRFQLELERQLQMELTANKAFPKNLREHGAAELEPAPEPVAPASGAGIEYAGGETQGVGVAAETLAGGRTSMRSDVTSEASDQTDTVGRGVAVQPGRRGGRRPAARGGAHPAARGGDPGPSGEGLAFGA